MAKTPFNSPILLDTGISLGDEGKGRLIPEVIQELQTQSGRRDIVGLVMKVNGGANSGHTCGGLKLNLFPAGVISSDIPVLGIGAGVVADPHKFIWEAAYIEHAGYPVMNRLLIDERTMVSDIGHRLLDLAWEYYRVEILGEEKRGSTGRGISPAYMDETAQFQITYDEFRADERRFRSRMAARLERAVRTIQHVCRVPEPVWRGFFATLTQAEQRANANLIELGLFPETAFDYTRYLGEHPFELKVALITEDYWKAGQQLAQRVGNLREVILQLLLDNRYLIGEFGQAYWLDKRGGFSPNVTASHTMAAEFFLSAGVPLQPAHIFGVCKAYDTKVGTHHFPCQFPEGHPLGERLKRLEFGTTTGRQRMVGWFDAVEKGDAIRYGGCHDLVINKLDALSFGGDWQQGNLLVCTGYRLPDGTVLRHVPRDSAIHRKVEPVYEAFPCWQEDISSVRTFADLPAAARRYVAGMVKATLSVAYGPEVDWPQKLPNLRYIGVGPEPSQIITDVPDTRDLLKLV